MDWWLALLLIIGSLIIMLLTGIPVAFAFMAINLLGIFYFMGPAGLDQLILSIFDAITKFTMAPVPFFVLMGAVIFQSGMAFRVLDILDQWLGRSERSSCSTGPLLRSNNLVSGHVGGVVRPKRMALGA